MTSMSISSSTFSYLNNDDNEEEEEELNALNQRPLSLSSIQTPEMFRFGSEDDGIDLESRIKYNDDYEDDSEDDDDGILDEIFNLNLSEQTLKKELEVVESLLSSAARGRSRHREARPERGEYDDRDDKAWRFECKGGNAVGQAA